MKTSDPKALAKLTRERAARLRKALPLVASQQAQAGQLTSQELTDGLQRPKSFRGPVTPKLPIGRRSRQLRRGWRRVRMSGSYQGAYAPSVALKNVAPHHVYVLRPGGTRKMSDRGYWLAQRTRSKSAREAIALRHLRAAMK